MSRSWSVFQLQMDFCGLGFFALGRLHRPARCWRVDHEPAPLCAASSASRYLSIRLSELRLWYRRLAERPGKPLGQASLRDAIVSGTAVCRTTAKMLGLDPRFWPGLFDPAVGVNNNRCTNLG